MRPPPVHGLVHGASPALNRHLALPPAAATRCFAVMIAHRPAAGGIVSGPERRLIHSSHRKSSTLPAELPPGPAVPPPQPTLEPSRAPLSVLPLSMILRSLGTTAVSSSPLLLAPSLRIMAVLAHSGSALLNPDRNPLLRFFLKRTFYAQFCAGEDGAEVRDTIARLKGIGFNGVILGYAKEVVLTDKQAGQLEGAKVGEETQTVIDNEIVPWAEGTLETVRLAEPGDFVALKFTGAGRLALHQLSHRLSATPYLSKSIDSICQLAHERGVRLLFDAEQDRLQDGIDDWTMEFSRKFNTTPGRATIFGTYQAYKKCAPAVLSRHLTEAREGNFTLGVKLVRGAYLGSDPRDRFFDTKADTDACYDGIAASVLTRQWNSVLEGQGEFPEASLVLATHNAESVRRARAIVDAGVAKSEIACAQLQGMADEISCELVELAGQGTAVPVYKYLVWGTTGECMKYLLRRAQENKDAVARTRSGRDAMWAEVVRRVRNAFRFA
ncbi:proline dehydrogenase [Purpureocillium takamizusanense]|uniref:Proline dehydrogenase n=1 Tax=Purpureocillium takamizusanense TaxID=2060973 RepID=A0A9Q8QQF8_9HYPO|nr:proline dehydrogenase [Purpureocillium takamizusanense]UNI22981.1 proline dehydrogenase [Purpureocillium takamizusanense]